MENREVSCGFIPLRRVGDWFEILLEKPQGKQYRGLPKGHIEQGQTHIEAAMRELYEETGYEAVRYWTGSNWSDDCREAFELEVFKSSGTNRFGKYRDKDVYFFIGEVVYKSEIQDTNEIELVEWYPLTREIGQLLRSEEHNIYFLECVYPYIQFN